jgi:CO/xanthine dehydrogenase Mo-binding subunit
MITHTTPNQIGSNFKVAMTGAVANAVQNAIGAMPKELPVTPEVVLRMLEAGK